ncbi:hypothetical protein [Algoriphagus sp. NG3]|uniref:hypothetical protein n=1 Tax=Algoriphagus sp. NG3 TaxID=3097546 RepID=UPI002A7FBE9B|nr:hypothetical protein [Algoriphagus sp. NG3]WPR76375.1 hypothetical protein SLW71_03320 [Algoriphagus sp. NG3]
MYYTELVLLIILGVGYSFVDLRNKQSAQVYLSLPGSAMEKYLVQFITRVVIFPVLFTIIFILAISLAKGHLSSATTFYNDDTTQVIDNLDIKSMILIFLSWNKPAITYFFVFGLLGLVTSLMFAGGIILGKWNSLLMPLLIFLFWLLMFFSLIALSWLVFGFPDPGSELFTVQFEFTQPIIYEGVPLFVVLITGLIWLAIPWICWVAYLKLKEREV